MLFDAFEATARSRPSQAAMEGPRGTLTYGELYNAARACAEWVWTYFPQDEYFGLAADQDERAVVAILALALLGKAVIPLDPRIDPALAARMLAPFATVALVGDGGTAPADPVTAVSLEHATAHPGHGEWHPPCRSTSMAYVLHTSGTTGRPKAVLASQPALLRVAGNLAERYYIDPTSRVLQFAYLGFDSAFVEIWATLLAGGTLIVPGERLRGDLYGTLRHFLKGSGITSLTLPPAIATHLAPESLEGVRSLVVAGETFPPSLANTLRERVDHCINAYGPTEAIICATTYEVRSKMEQNVPIGTPLPGVRIALVDASGTSVKRGEVGELWICGDALAEGYALDPDRTAVSFGSRADLGRYYRSGDLAWQMPSGDFVFSGRADRQVKIRGQRVELEQVEAALQELGPLQVAVVVYNHSGPRPGMHCVYENPVECDEVNLAASMTTRLPGYAIPRSYLRVKTMPLDRNGKVDRERAGALIDGAYEAGCDLHFEADSDTLLARMLSLWVRVLGDNTQPDPDGDFFNLGGDSLDALRLVDEIQASFGVQLRLKDVIAEPATPRRLAEVVQSAQATNTTL